MELMILFCRVKGKFRRIHNKHQCSTIGVITPASGKVELVPSFGRCIHQHLGVRPIDTAWDTHQVPIFGSSVLELIWPISLFIEQLAILRHKVCKFVLWNLQLYHFSVPQIAIIRDLCSIVIAHLSILGTGVSSRVSSARRNFQIVRSPEQVSLSYNEFMLDMPRYKYVVRGSVP